MTISDKGIDLIKSFEGYRANAYLDVAGVPTIGWGSIAYCDGTKVKIGDKIGPTQANKMLLCYLEKNTSILNGLNVTQNQYDALCSFIYNLGAGALSSSTMLHKIKVNPKDPTIPNEFRKWCKARVNGKLITVPGLSRRREAEAELWGSY